MTIIIRPLDPATEAGYLHSTARAATVQRWGGGFVDYPTVKTMVDDMLAASTRVDVATFEDDPSILGYAVWGPGPAGPDAGIEFLHLRKSLADDGRAAGSGRPPPGSKLTPRPTAALVLAALLPQADPHPLTNRERATWGSCTDCRAYHGVPCRERDHECRPHARRFDAAPTAAWKVTLRRPPPGWVLDALLLANFLPSIRPRSI